VHRRACRHRAARRLRPPPAARRNWVDVPLVLL